MLPFGDVIPTRTRPVLTALLSAGALALVAVPSLRPFALLLVVDALVMWVFGPTLEDRTGHARFAAFAATGAAAAVVVVTPAEPAPLALVAASGVAAMLGGGYLARFPTAQVLTLVPSPAGIEVCEIPAWFVAGVWGVVHAAAALAAETPSGPLVLAAGWLAAGGLGAVLVWPFSRRERDHAAWWGA